MRKTLKERFEVKTKLNSETGCIEWQAQINDYGYGRFKKDGKPMAAHRVAWELAHDSIPDGLFVLHGCDNRKCVNVDHLFLGTHQDNMDDMVFKGRHHSRGPRKITEAVALAVASMEGTYEEIGNRVGLHRTQVSRIKRGLCWTHLNRVGAT
jgi:hypothetical protein